MDFFKSVLTNDQSPPDSPEIDQPKQVHCISDSDINQPWSFGGLIKTLASKSDSMIRSYRVDIDELRSGVRHETAVIREVTSRAVKGIPSTLDVGASVAERSLEFVGQAVDDIGASMWKSATRIISQGKERLLHNDVDTGFSSSNVNLQRTLDTRPYNRFKVKLKGIQLDLNTYCTEPENVEEYMEWRSGFRVDENQREIDDLLKENPVIGEFYQKIVPNLVNKEDFWCRYFYKVHKLRQTEEVAKRVIAVDEDEDLSWDLDEKSLERNGDSTITCSSLDLQTGVKISESCKDSDISVVSSQPLMPDDEGLYWVDEVEEIRVIEQTRRDSSANTSRVDVRKILAAAEDEDDFSWDVEDHN